MSSTMLPPTSETTDVVAPRVIDDPEATQEALIRQAFIESLQGKPFACQSEEHEGHTCEKANQPEVHISWLATHLLKSYISSIHVGLTQMGWVPQQIVDVGCGNGLLLGHVGKMFADNVEFNVMGLDESATLIERAKQDNCCRIEFNTMQSGESLPFAEASVDLVMSHGFLTQTPMAQHWFAEMCRISAEGVIIAVPNVGATAFFQQLPKAWFEGMPWHRDAFLQTPSNPVTPAHIKTWLKQAGYTVELTLSPTPYTMIVARRRDAK